MGEAEQAMTFTAIGEPITYTNGTRWVPHPCGAGVGNSAGAWGYEQLSELHEGASGNAPSGNWLHVGHRTYDPTTGRFLERDPIGIRGALSVYAYVNSNSVTQIDSDGLFPETFWDYPGGPGDHGQWDWLPEPGPGPAPETGPGYSYWDMHPSEEHVDPFIHGSAGVCFFIAGITWWCPPVAGGFAGAGGAIEGIYWFWSVW